MLLTETSLVIVSLVLAFVWPTLGARWFERIEIQFSRLAKRRGLAVIVVGMATLALRIAVLPVEPVPQPCVHDEFAYLLQADTFAHGRLANPTPVMWQHFETFHVLFQPTYCSKYFPGQALFLALGQIVFGHPFWGVWLSSGVMCAAITWMLQGWFSEEWALVGGMLAMLRFGVFGYWADSYWGGNVAAIGGALALGALPRIKASQRVLDSILLGLGLALLAYSRPWEGLVLSVPIAVVLFTWMLGRNRPSLASSLRQVILPLGLVLGFAAAWLGYYCWRTTGNPLRPPYTAYEATYGAVPYMVWQHPRPHVEYRHEILRKMHMGQEGEGYKVFFSFDDFVLRIFSTGSFFFGPILLLPFLLLFPALPKGFGLRDISPTTRLVVFFLGVFAVGTEMAIYYNPHYSAPVIGLILALVLLAMQRVRAWSRSGVFLSRAIVFACVIAFSARVLAGPLHISKSKYSTYYWDEFFELKEKGWFPRAEDQAEVEKIPGNHLIIVRYDPDHLPFPDWVNNDADIDHSRVIWARDMGAEKNQELLDYFKDRKAWLLEPDENPWRLLPYPTHQGEAQSVAGPSKSSAGPRNAGR